MDERERLEVQLTEFGRQGHWTLEKPTTPGRYIVASRGADCAVRSYSQVIVYELSDGTTATTQSWGGWWWSVPMPDLIPTPDYNPSSES